MGDQCVAHVIIRISSTLRMYLLSLFLLWFFIKFLSNVEVFFYLFKGNFWDITHPCKLFSSQYIRYDNNFFVSLIVFHVFIISCSISMHCMTYPTSYHLIIPMLFPSFSKMLTMLILVLKESELDQVHMFQYICCQSFQIYLLIITFHFAHTNLNDHQDLWI